MPGEEDAQVKEEEKKAEETPAELFDQAFAEAAQAVEEPEKKAEEKQEESAEKKEETPVEGEKKEEAAAESKEEVKPEEKTEPKPEGQKKEEVAREQARQEEKEEVKPQPKAPEKKEEREEVREEKKKEEREDKSVDYSLFFTGLENDITDPEERKAYQELLKDSEDVGKFTVRTAELVGHRVIGYVNESFKVLVDKLAPFIEATRKQMEQSHRSAISVKHADYEELRESKDVAAWIDEQPRYLQKAMKAVFKDGEPEEVIDLIDRYKKDRGIGQKKEEEKTAVVDAEKEKAKSEKERKIQEKIDNLSVVKTKDRPVSAQGTRSLPADDYDSAFDEAAGTKRR